MGQSRKRVRCPVAVSRLVELRTTRVAARWMEREGADSSLEIQESGVGMLVGSSNGY